MQLASSYLSEHVPGQRSVFFRCHGIQCAFVQGSLVAAVLVWSFSCVNLLEGEAWPTFSISLVHMGHHSLTDVNVGQVLVANIIKLFTQLRVAATNYQHLGDRCSVKQCKEK